MIQLKRGSTSSWLAGSTKLAEGQPGYDKDLKKIKIGDGKHTWAELPNASGLRADEILDSEDSAKTRLQLANPILVRLGLVDTPLFTYGTDSPSIDGSKSTVGKVYMQYYDAAPEVDYVIESGSSGTATGWNYLKYASGKALCWGTFIFNDVLVGNKLGDSGLYSNVTDLTGQNYPVEFAEVPTETATLKSVGGVAWLATGKTANSKTKPASYKIVSPIQAQTTANFSIELVVCGRYAED